MGDPAPQFSVKGGVNMRTDETFSLVFPGADEAIDPSASDLTAYLSTGDENTLVFLAGKEPTRYIFRPLTRRERDVIISDPAGQDNPAVRGYSVVGTTLMEVTGKYTGDQLERARRPIRGLRTIPDDSAVWDTMPEGAVVYLGFAAFLRSFR